MSKSHFVDANVALLLNCDDPMAEAFVKAGYVVKRGSTGLTTGTPVLPVSFYDVDVVAMDWRPGLVPVGSPSTIGARGDSGTPGLPVLDTTPVARPSPAVSLHNGRLAMAAGVPCICFVNKAVVPLPHAVALFEWLVPDLRIAHASDNLKRCTAQPLEVWSEFFRSAASPIAATLRAVYRTKPTETREVPDGDDGSTARDNDGPPYAPGQVQSILVNPAGQANALMIREGYGAVFLLPEFTDNASAAVRLVREIWPRLLDTWDSAETGTTTPGKVAIGQDRHAPPPPVALSLRQGKAGPLESPEQAVAAMRRHVAEYPAEDLPLDELPGKHWVTRYHELLCRWVEAVYTNPDAGREFEGLAGLPMSENATKLFRDLEAAMLAACKCLEPHVAALDAKGDALIHGTKGLSVEAMAYLARRVRRLSNPQRRTRDGEPVVVPTTGKVMLQVPYGHCSTPSPEAVRGDLEVCGQYLDRLREWNDQCLGRAGGARFTRSAGRAEQALVELRKLLCHGIGADLWELSYDLIEHYVAYDPSPDPAIGATVRYDWPSMREPVQTGLPPSCVHPPWGEAATRGIVQLMDAVYLSALTKDTAERITGEVESLTAHLSGTRQERPAVDEAAGAAKGAAPDPMPPAACLAAVVLTYTTHLAEGQPFKTMEELFKEAGLTRQRAHELPVYKSLRKMVKEAVAKAKRARGLSRARSRYAPKAGEHVVDPKDRGELDSSKGASLAHVKKAERDADDAEHQEEMLRRFRPLKPSR